MKWLPPGEAAERRADLSRAEFSLRPRPDRLESSLRSALYCPVTI